MLVTQVATGGAFGGKEDLNVQGHAALLALTADRPVLLALSRADSLRFSIKRHRFWMDYTVACDGEGIADGGQGPLRRRQRRLRQRRRQGPRACRRAMPAAPTRCPTSTSRPAPSNQQPALRRHARVRCQPGQLRHGDAARPPRRGGRHRRLGDPLAQCARGRQPLRHRPEADPGVGLKDTLLAVKDQYQERQVRGHRLRRQEHRHRQRHEGVRPRRGAARGRRQAHGLPLLDRDGAGHPYRDAPDRQRRAGPGARSHHRRRRHQPRARYGHHHRLARDDARRPGRPPGLRGSAGRDGQAALPARRPRRRGVPGRDRRRLDHAARVPTSRSPSRTSATAGPRRSASSTRRAASRSSSRPTTWARRSTR